MLTVHRMHPTFLLLGSVLTLAVQIGLLTFNSAVSASSNEISSVSLSAPSTTWRHPNGTVGFSARPSPRNHSTSKFLGAWLLAFVDEDSSPREEFSNSTDGPTFATISIKPSHSTDPRNERMRVLPNGDLTAQAVSLASLLSFAYDVAVNPSPTTRFRPEFQAQKLCTERSK
jgi:hypothetical protein